MMDLKPINATKKISRDIVQCRRCLKRWDRGRWLKSCPRCGSGDIDYDSRTNPTHINPRLDLMMLTSDRYLDRFCPSTTTEEEEAEKRFLIAKYGPARLFITRRAQAPEDGHHAYLYEGDTLWMSSWKRERLTMLCSVMYECPSGSRVFIGGLGLGLILLYLAASEKVGEVVVAELSENVIGLIEPIIRPWLAENFPDFNWTLVQGNAYEEVSKHGKFDWIFFDIWKDAKLMGDNPEVKTAYEASEGSFTEGGRFSTWMDSMRIYGGYR